MDIKRVETREDPRDTPLTAKRTFYGSPDEVEMTLTPQQVMGLSWLLMHCAMLYAQPVKIQHWGGTWVGVDVIKDGDHRFPRSFAIWDTTGAVYQVGDDGAVEDDPIYDPSGKILPPEYP